MFDAAYIQAGTGMTAFETVENFARFRILPRLIVENAERGITARPFGQEVNGAFEAFGSLDGISAQSGDNAESPENFAGAWNAFESLR